jgi:hypothetical protein
MTVRPVAMPFTHAHCLVAHFMAEASGSGACSVVLRLLANLVSTDTIVTKLIWLLQE